MANYVVARIDEDKQVALIRFTDTGQIIGVNLWEIEGFKRKADGYHTNQYEYITDEE